MTAPIEVLIVDDSPTSRHLLSHLVGSSPDMRVVGEATNGRQAIRLVNRLRPHIVLMDVIMEDMDGLDATREIMQTVPTPIILISATLEVGETSLGFRAMNLGALALQRKPDGPGHPDYPAQAAELVNKLRLLSQVRVIRHWNRTEPQAPPNSKAVDLPRLATFSDPHIVGIVSSTGGPAALNSILSRLPADFPVPIVIVQHISADFIDSLRGWMATQTALRVEIAQPGGLPQPGTVYFAPDGAHLRLNVDHTFRLDTQRGSERHFPAGNALLESIAQNYGAHSIGIVLTGIGDDGARGLRAMYDAGAFTIAQDEQSSVVYGMPKAAAALGAASQVLNLEEIPATLERLSTLKETES